MARDKGANRPRRVETDSEQRVEPEEARAHGNDPDAVRLREGERTDDDSGRVERLSDEGRARERVSGAQSAQDTDVIVRRDSARWGPIWAGLIAALTTFLLLELLAFGLGLTTPNLGTGTDNTASAWVSGIIGLIAFFTGGSVAGMTSSVRGTATGLLNGFLVWALGTVVILVLSALGLGQIFGALGSVIGQLGQINLLQGGLNAPNANIDPQQLLDTLRTTAIGAFFSLMLAAIFSALGGWLGGRTNNPIGHMAHDDKD